MDLIFETRGESKEFAELGINIYRGCTHQCRYCYGAKMPFLPAESYYAAASPVGNVAERLRKDVGKIGKNCPEILMSFRGDVYQPTEMELGLTRQAIEVLIEHELPFTVLTKGGTRAIRDFDLLEGYEKARFGTTLICWDQSMADYWEPNAPGVRERIRAIEQAYKRGISTWVSLTPVVDADQALRVICELHPIIGYWIVGKLNYIPIEVDWVRFKEEAVALLESIGADWYLRKDLMDLERRKKSGEALLYPMRGILSQG